MFRIIGYLIIVIISIILSISSYAKDRDFNIYVSHEAQFVVTDPLGRKTGFDPITNTKYKESKNQYYAETGGDEVSGELKKWYANIKDDAIDGIYKIKVICADSLYYSVTIDYPQPLNMRNLTTSAFSYAGKVDYYEFNYNYAQGVAGVPLTLTRIITPSAFIDDINAMAKLDTIGLHYIGNKQFVSKIIKKAEALGLSKSDQKKGYTELLKEIAEKYNKPESDEFVKQEAYTVLKEDLEYIIGHL